MAHRNAHGHAHGHTQNEHGSESLGEWNKKHFDGAAANMFQTPWVARLADQVSLELTNSFDWIDSARQNQNKATKLLDYACGNGVVSRALAARVQMCRGIDISSEMAKQYNLVAKEASYSSEKMHAIQGDLLDVTATPSPELETDAYKKFDFAVMSLALHHVNDVEGMIRRLAERLDEGGVLVIADWVAESNGGHHKHQNHGHGVHAPHHGGFTEADLRKIFEKAGLGNWGWKLFEKPLEVPSAPGRQKQGFLARGTKGA